MNARDIMTSPVVSVAPDATVAEIAAMLVERHISAVPVVDDGLLVGIVSQRDLLHRYEIGTDRAHPARAWWLALLGGDPAPAAYVKSHARRARDIMTRDVVAVEEGTPIAQIAQILDARRVKRVPVLRDGRPVGIVSRASFVRALAARSRSAPAPSLPSDDAIRQQLLAELDGQPWWRDGNSTVRVVDGVVHYLGLLDSYDAREAARIAAENVPGVRGVEDHRLRLPDVAWMT